MSVMLKQMICLSATLSLIFVNLCFAERVRTVGGKEYEGQITEKTDEYIKLQTASFRIKIPFNMLDKASQEAVSGTVPMESKAETQKDVSGEKVFLTELDENELKTEHGQLEAKLSASPSGTDFERAYAACVQQTYERAKTDNKQISKEYLKQMDQQFHELAKASCGIIKNSCEKDPGSELCLTMVERYLGKRSVTVMPLQDGLYDFSLGKFMIAGNAIEFKQGQGEPVWIYYQQKWEGPQDNGKLQVNFFDVTKKNISSNKGICINKKYAAPGIIITSFKEEALAQVRYFSAEIKPCE